MSSIGATSLRTQDWEHRLGVLAAWRHVLSLPLQDRHLVAVYGAVLDGCAVTLRALCYSFLVKCDFRDFEKTLPAALDRVSALRSCQNGKRSVHDLTPDAEEQRCLLEVLFLANRAVAHPTDGKNLDHAAGGTEMTTAINLILKTLKLQISQLPALGPVFQKHPELFQPIPLPPPAASKRTIP